MARARMIPALVAHGGAGAVGPRDERATRRRAMLAAVRLGAKMLRENGSALDAVVATVAALEDHPLFNAGYGSLLNSEGAVEMDASVMMAEPAAGAGIAKIGRRPVSPHRHDEREYTVSAGAVAAAIAGSLTGAAAGLPAAFLSFIRRVLNVVSSSGFSSPEMSLSQFR